MPGRLESRRDVEKCLDLIIEFYERTVVHHVDNFARMDRIDRILLFHVVPWVREHLLHAESNFDFLPVDVENHDFDFLIH